jgi:tRNA pseudouridine13 synthase
MVDPQGPIFPWPRTARPPLVSARLRAAPEDFVVEEQMPFVLAGAGEHLWLKVRKRGFNTEQVAKQLARMAGVTRREVGYAGMKDRHAVAVQWFSLYLPGRRDPDWGTLPDGMTLIEGTRHTRKLKTGALSGNRFEIVLRNCQGDRAATLHRSTEIRTRGVPNYFGEQRFGHGGGNIAEARALFAGENKRVDRKQNGIYLSAARSFLFNQVLAQRVPAGTWDVAVDGDAMILNGTRSFFVPEAVDDTIRRRLAESDIHPSGPLWGRGELPTRATTRAIEQAVADEHPDLAGGLERAGMDQERRALRVIPQDLQMEWLDDTSLRLRFGLPAGTYATALLRELAVYTTASRPGDENE